MFLKYLVQKDLNPMELRLPDIEAYRVSLVQANRYAPITILTYLRGVKELYGWLRRTGMMQDDPTKGLRFSKPPKSLPRHILTLTETRLLLDLPPSRTPRDARRRAILEIFYSTAIRVSELSNLKTTDIDLAQGVLRVNNGKGGKDRVVPLGDAAAAAVRDYLESARPYLARETGSWLFPGRHGKPLSNHTVGITVRDRGREAGILKPVTPHSLRHTCATQMLQQGANIFHIQQLLGHSSATTTQIYARVNSRDMQKTLEKYHPRERRLGLLKKVHTQLLEMAS